MINVPENFADDSAKLTSVNQVQKSLAKGKDFLELVKKYSMAANAVETEGILPLRSVNELPPQLKEKIANLKINDVVGPLRIGNAVFFFQYLGAQFGSGSSLKANYTSWKNKLLNIKFEERLMGYLKNERSTLRVNMRPFTIQR